MIVGLAGVDTGEQLKRINGLLTSRERFLNFNFLLVTFMRRKMSTFQVKRKSREIASVMDSRFKCHQQSQILAKC